ncbi:MAG: TonB-dependent receptor [Gammaproteobacteria bacterium]|nr:TonB-dependent receptor [Gammaproteobacteria bacterium]
MRRPGLRGAAANTVAAAVAGILYSAAGYAQDQSPATAPAADSLQEVVVTANAANGVKKLDASYNIVSADAEQIRMANPKSTADILKVSPGIWPESSGGQTGANIEIAGIPGGGDAPFFTNMIEGTPMYGMPSLSFMDSSSLFRLDDTVDRVEVVQGGPGAIFGPGQMGATANFILRRGTATPSGSLGLTYGNEGLYRVDGFYGFPISEGWYGSIGGFYRESNGVRDPQFKADKGGQLTGTLSHDLDGGSLMFWARALDDKNQFIVPIPLIQTGSDSFGAYPGFDPLTGAYGSHNIQHVTLPNPGGGLENADLANGRGGELYYLGSKWEQKFGDWNVLNNFLIDGGHLNTNALFSGPNPRPLGYYLYGCQAAAGPLPAGYCSGTGTPVDTNNLGPGGMGLTGAVSANYVGGGAVPLSQSVITQGWWYIQKTLKNLVDEFRVSRMIFDGDTLTGGIYLARYSDDDNWSLGNTMLMTNTPHATAITLTCTGATGPACGAGATAPGGTYNITSPQGFVSYNNNYNILEHGNANNIAAYLSNSWKSGPLLIDVSARVERLDANQRTCNRTPTALGGPFDLWDNAVPICNGTWDYEHYVRTRPSYTGGINYEIGSNMSVYARANTGVHFDDFDNGIRGAMGKFSPLETLTNYEAGFKFQNQFAYVDISVYKKDFTGLQYQETDTQGNPLSAISNYGSDSKGINFITTLTPIEHFNIRLVGDYMNGKYTDYIGCAPYKDINGNTQCISINGAPLQRQPKFQIRVTPSYTVPGTWGDATLWVTYEHVGQRYEDQSGLQPLGSYYMLSGGLVVDVGKNWQFRLQGTNLTNQIALTEGNARIFGVNTGIGGVIMARPIEGREINVQAKYLF